MAVIRGGVSGNLAEVSADGAIYFKEKETETFLGTYQAEIVTAAIQNTTAHTVNTQGFAWAFNPSTSGVIVKLERVGLQIAQTTAVAAGFPTAPRIIISKFTYTGTPSGATVAFTGTGSTQGKFDANYPTAILDWRTAITGATCTYGHSLFSTMAPAIPIVGTVTTSQIAGMVSDNEYQPRESEYEHVVRPGEGIVIWQPEVGSTGDTRKLVTRIFWEEVTIP